MIRVFLACVGAMVLAMSPLSAAAAPPPLSAYGALPAIENVTISRNGSQLAYVAVSGERRTLVAQTLDGRALGMVNVGDAKVRGLQWAGPDDLIIVTSATGSSEYFLGRHEWLFATSYNLKRRRFVDLAGHIPDIPLLHLSGYLIAHWPGMYGSLSIAVPLTANLLIFAGAVHDKLTVGRIHPVSLWLPLLWIGGTALLLSVVPQSAAWRQFSLWLVGT